MSEDSGFQWDRDDEVDEQPVRRSGPGPQMSDAKADLEAKKQLAAEGFIVEGFNDDEDQDEDLQEEDFEQEEEEEYEEEEDAASALIRSVRGPDKSTKSVLEEAKIRLEKARLYEMIMKADIFDDIEADPRAVAKVREEFNDFGKERLEILLGMKAEKQAQEPQVVEMPHYPAHDLNELEVLAIKDLAAKLTGGESLSAGAPQPKKVQIQQQPAKSQGLRSLKQASQQPQRREAPAPAPRPQKQFVKERSQRAQQPVKQIKKKNGEVKQVHEMSEQELRERNKQVRSAPKGVPLQKPLPMPDGDATWGGGAQAGDARGGGGGQNLTNLLARALGATGIQDVGNGDE